MASLIFSHSKQIVNKSQKEANRIANLLCKDDNIDNWRNEYNKAYNMLIEKEFKQFDEYLKISSELHTRYINLIKPPQNQNYFITIRPDDNKCNFIDFKEKCLNFVNRKCFINYTLTFEQKGTCIDDLGKGFHCHIVAKMKQRSKGEIIRDTLSSWNDWINNKYITENCIEIIPTKNPEALVNNYLIEYKSEDNHKIKTKDWDDIWRSNMSIEKIYSTFLKGRGDE